MKRILLIEDNLDDVLIVKRILSKHPEGFEIDVATTGKEGMEKFTKQARLVGNFDCLLLGHRLPDTNVLELLKEIRKNYLHTPVIILTGLKDERLLTEALKLGAVNFLVKDQIQGDILPRAILDAILSGQKNLFLEEVKEHIYEGLIESMGEGLFALDVTETIVFTNPRLAEILGYQETDILGRSVFDLMDEESVDVFLHEYCDIKAGKRCSFEITLISMTKDKIPVSINQIPLFEENGVFNGSLSLVTDMTVLKRMEKKLVDAERLATMSQIASEAVHEIRNPLTVIKSGLYYLKSILPREENIEKSLLPIEKAVDRVNSYIEDLLNLSKPPVLELNSVSINNLIEESLKEIPSDILSNIEINKELKEDIPRVNVDIDRLKRVFINLIRNGLESMQGKGKLKIEAAKSKDEKFILISFEDTGLGIQEKNLRKIFDPFFTTKDNGTGLGLAICKRIIDAHSGKIDVESKINRGSKFVITLNV